MKNRFCALGSVYAGENPFFFEQAMRSVIDQTTPVPIILVIDGMLTDDLERVVSEFSNTISHIIRIPENAGLANALAEGLDYALPHFDYAIRFDTDDINLPERFEKLIDLINAGSFDLIGSAMEERSGNYLEKIVGLRSVPTDLREIRNKIIYKNPFNHPSVAFRIGAVLNCGGYENYPYFEDWYLWAKLVSSDANVCNLDQPLVWFRMDKNTLSRRRGIKYLWFEFLFFRGLMKMNLERKTLIPFFFLLRALTRLMPSALFAFVYKLARRVG